MNAKYGKLSVRLFSKLHIMHMLHGTVCAAVVAPGKVNDPPHLRLMIEMLPEGDGDVPADAAYDGVKNCSAISDSGRRAIIYIKSNEVINGFNAGAEMLRFGEDHPGTFHRILRLRNNVGSVFSSMKARFGGVVRPLRETTRSVELPSTTVRYNTALA